MRYGTHFEIQSPQMAVINYYAGESLSEWLVAAKTKLEPYTSTIANLFNFVFDLVYCSYCYFFAATFHIVLIIVLCSLFLFVSE